MSKKRISLKYILLLQSIVIIYTLSGICSKFASQEAVMSKGFILFYALEILILGIYAILWQQMIKRVDLSIAYANRATAILWSMLWAMFIFKESITLNNIIGVMIVLVGTIIVNSDNG